MTIAFNFLYAVLFCAIICLMWRLYQRDAIIFAGLSAFMVDYLLVTISLFAIENGVPLFELGRIGYRNYSFIVYSGFFAGFIFVAFNCRSGLRWNRRRKMTPTWLLWTYAFFLVAVVSMMNFHALFFFRDKWDPYVGVVFPGLTKFVDQILVYLTYYYIVTSHRRYIVPLVSLYLVDSALKLTLQTAFIQVGVFLLIRLAFENNGKPFRIPKSIILWGPIVLAISIEARVFLLTNQKLTILSRLFSQGELMWYSLNASSNESIMQPFLAFLRNFLSVRNVSLQSSYGLGRFMIQAGGLGPAYVTDRVSFSTGMPGILIYYFGIVLGLFIYLVLAWIVVRYTRLLMKSIAQYRIFSFLLLSFVGNYVIEVFSQGMYEVVNLRLVIFIILFFFVDKIFYPAFHTNARSKSSRQLAFTSK